MQKIISIIIFLSIATLANSQTNLLVGKNLEEIQKILDSAMQSRYFITVSDAQSVLEKPVHLKDSTYKYSGGVLRYSFDYVVSHVDSISKGKMFFSFEQYKNPETAKSIYQSIKSENQKNNSVTALKDIGDDAFLQKDNLNQPFIFIIKGNEIFKLRVYYLTSQTSLEQLILISKKVVSTH